jgi:ubiquinone biosynthesis monooxygenase Coq7
MLRRIGLLDRLIEVCDEGLRAVAATPRSQRPSPADQLEEPALTGRQREQSAALMRVNRAGEIAAQALYNGQSLFARDADTAAHLRRAAAEETDHLAWCTRRLRELGGRPSVFDPLWYLGSLAVGSLAALGGDSSNLGFVAETERQVEAHIADHLDRLPASDVKSRSILEQMRADEVRHGAEALAAGGRQIREPVPSLMAIGGEILRRLAYRL